jgi:hypothetical protein
LVTLSSQEETLLVSATVAAGKRYRFVGSSHLVLVTVLTGALAPFAIGLVVRAVLQARGEEVLETSVMVRLLHIWVLMAFALALASLPAALMLRLSCAGDDLTPIGWGMFFGFEVAVIGVFSVGWLDAHSLVEGFALAAPIWVALMAALYTVGALLGGGLGFMIGRITRVNRQAPDEIEGGGGAGV